VVEWARAFAAPALLVLVALTQLTLVHTTDLSPWLGGGFGMFATIESRSERHFVAYAETPGLLRELTIPPALEDEAERVRAWPTEARLRGLARKLLAFEERAGVPPTRLRLQLWRTRYATGSLSPETNLTREVRVDRG
jgi:hypothetical protein